MRSYYSTPPRVLILTKGTVEPDIFRHDKNAALLACSKRIKTSFWLIAKGYWQFGTCSTTQGSGKFLDRGKIHKQARANTGSIELAHTLETDYSMQKSCILYIW